MQTKGGTRNICYRKIHVEGNRNSIRSSVKIYELGRKEQMTSYVSLNFKPTASLFFLWALLTLDFIQLFFRIRDSLVLIENLVWWKASSVLKWTPPKIISCISSEPRKFNPRIHSIGNYILVCILKYFLFFAMHHWQFFLASAFLRFLENPLKNNSLLSKPNDLFKWCSIE